MWKTFILRITYLLRLFWTGVSVCRRVVGNLLFLALIVFLAVLVFFGGARDVPDGAALILAPAGKIVEQKTETVLANQIFGEAAREETLLREIIDVIDYARDDRHIKALVLDLRDMDEVDTSKLQDIGAALKRFKTSQKRIFAFADYYGQPQYYLAAHADSLYLNPMGGILLTGFGLYRHYFKSALDKLKVQFHVFRAGTYKSALEPFLRDDMSEYAKEANTAWLNVLWEAYKTDVAALRGLTPDRLDDAINNLPHYLAQVKGDTAQLALDQGWVDALKTRDEIRAELIELVGADEEGETYKQIEFGDYLDIIRPALAKKRPHQAQVGVIVAQGIILDGPQPPGQIGGDSLAELICQARNDDMIKAVVLRIDSPGGSAFASEIIRREIELTRQEGKPVVVSMGAVAASGGYWIAAGADEIWATPTTITGSIGIFGAFPTFEKSLDSLGIHNDGVGTTQLADAFEPSRSLNPMVADMMQQIIEQGYRRFIDRVAEGRKMSPETVEKIAQGRIWSGKTAAELGLVDNLGRLPDAIRSAAEKADLDDYEVTYVEAPLTARERLIQRLNRLVIRLVGNNPRYAMHPAAKWRQFVGSELDQLVQLNDPQGVYAYCLNCALP
ncbi:MAG: signal peptide peptidase SppA [Desulfobacterales bacterium]|nr:MAG: signal peptide peptidase SppA [Desulfobacterales bacterium]